MAIIGVTPYANLPTGVQLIWKPHPEVIAQEIMQIAGYLENTTAPLQLSKQIAQADMRMKFETQTDPDGVPWVPWSPEYKRPPGKILTLTGAMAASAENSYFIRPNTLWWSMDQPYYWRWHETGTGTVWEPPGGIEIVHEVRLGGRGQHLPQRRFVSITEGAQLKILAVFEQWFDGAITIRSSSRRAGGHAVARIAPGRPGAGRFGLDPDW